jgi:hypothetical protein
MRVKVIPAIVTLLALQSLASDRTVHTRKIPCKTEAIAPSCYWTHGQLRYGNGTPALRLWKTGTNRLLGIFSGPSINIRGDDNGDNEHPELPANITKRLVLGKTAIWADFQVCPLEAQKPGVMQPACVESAKNVFIEKLD